MVLVNMVAILIMPTKLATLGLLKIKVFWNKCYDVKIKVMMSLWNKAYHMAEITL